MTYFGFLLRFLGIPLVLLFLLTWIDSRRGSTVPRFFNGRVVGWSIGLHVLIAVAYTTPWDNYLVATGVWYYDSQLISGTLLGWVPLEEYIFFVLETILVGLWWWLVARRLTLPERAILPENTRIFSTVILGVIWLLSVAILAVEWRPGTYLALILAWALPAIMLQTGFGGDILWHYRKLVIWGILPVFLYLSATDSLAIAAGTWTIDPAQSTGIFIGALPLEEAVFFLVTVVLINFGMTLSLACISQKRLIGILRKIAGKQKVVL